MLAIGIWTGTLGYAVLYYGVKLFAGAPVTIAEALGIPGARGPLGITRLGPGSIDYLHRYGLTTQQVHDLRVKAVREGRAPGYYLPGGPGWQGPP